LIASNRYSSGVGHAPSHAQGQQAAAYNHRSQHVQRHVVLARHAGEVLSRDQILQRLRGIEFNGTDRSVDVAISKLRRKFDDDAGEARKIKTVWGKGYLFSRSEWEC